MYRETEFVKISGDLMSKGALCIEISGSSFWRWGQLRFGKCQGVVLEPATGLKNRINQKQVSSKFTESTWGWGWFSKVKVQID